MGDTVADEPARFVRAMVFAPAVILGYDTLLTFSREVDCIWNRKFSAVTVLYVLQRYTLLFCVILRQYNPSTIIACKALLVMQDITNICSMMGVAAFSVLRTYAICGRVNVPVVLVFLCSMFLPAINLYNYSRPQEYLVIDGGCVVMMKGEPPIRYFPIITRCIAMISDVLVLLITWAKTADTWKTALRNKLFKPHVSMLLVRDGTVYFIALFALNAVTLLLNVLALHNDDSATSFNFINEAIAPTLIARFILDLRSVYFPRETSEVISTMHFASSPAIGNLAAPIGSDSTWVSGSSDDVYTDRGSQYQESKEPFSVGLGCDKAETEVQLHDLTPIRYTLDEDESSPIAPLKAPP